MSASEYLMMLKRVLVKGRSVIKESPEHYKVYLPTEYNDLWTELKNRGVVVDVVVFLLSQHYGVSKILIRDKSLVRESERFKIYLSKAHNVSVSHSTKIPSERKEYEQSQSTRTNQVTIEKKTAGPPYCFS
ncbi:MAG: hypothetical protein QXJ97_07755 [Desulfurococcaceae archaeon]